MVGCKVKLWDAATGKELATLTRGGRPLCMYGAIEFSPDGRLLAAGLHDGTISFWGLMT